MEDKYYICKHSNSCSHSRDKECPFGTPILKSILDKMCHGVFKPQFTISCDHPKVQAGVLLIKSKNDYIEGNYHNIWKEQ